MSDTASPDRSRVRIVLCDRRTHIINSIKTALNREGFERVDLARTLPELRSQVMSGLPDLIVADVDVAEEGGGDTLELIRRMRNGEEGPNPFIVVVVTSWRHEATVVKRAVNAGVDDVLLSPISPGQLLGRIEIMIKDRKPFIVTSDYIGPERRKDPKRKSEIPNFVPPNTLKMKIERKSVLPEEVSALVEETLTEVNVERLRRIGIQISFLVGLIDPALINGRMDDEIKGYIHRLKQTTIEAIRRLYGTEFEAVAVLCDSMLKVATRMDRAPEAISHEDKQLIVPLSLAITEAFNPGRDREALIGEIATAIGGYLEREAAKRAIANAAATT